MAFLAQGKAAFLCLEGRWEGGLYWAEEITGGFQAGLEGA